jgi:hypothetical protein
MVERVTVSREIHAVVKANMNVQGAVVAPSALVVTSTRPETIQVQASSAAASDNPCQPENLPLSSHSSTALGDARPTSQDLMSAFGTYIWVWPLQAIWNIQHKVPFSIGAPELRCQSSSSHRCTS